MSELREIGGVLVPTLGRGASLSLEDQLLENVPPEHRKFRSRRDKMIEQNREEWERDKNRTGQ